MSDESPNASTSPAIQPTPPTSALYSHQQAPRFQPTLPTSVLGSGTGQPSMGMVGAGNSMFLQKRAEGGLNTFEKKYQILVEMGNGVHGTVYKVKPRVPRGGVAQPLRGSIIADPNRIYAAKKLFQKTADNTQNEILARQPEHTKQRYNELFEKDNSLSVRRLKIATSKLFIRERQILQDLPRHENIVNLIEVISQPLRETVTVLPAPQNQQSRQISQVSSNLAGFSALAANPAFLALGAQTGSSTERATNNLQVSPRPHRITREVPNRYVEYLIFEFAEHELASILASKISFQVRHVKCLMMQLLQGLAHLERNKVLHRDLKPANVLLNREGVLKIIDFGYARYTSQDHLKEERRQYTRDVTTPLYRAPEVFLGVKLYTSKVDVWAAGLICYELLTQTPLFPQDKGERGVVLGMFNIFGVPDDSSWPGLSQLPIYKKLLVSLQQERGLVHPKGLKSSLPSNTSSACLDFFSKMLTMCPEKRISASEALRHPYLVSEEPMACLPSELPRFECEMSQKFAQKQKNMSSKKEQSFQLLGGQQSQYRKERSIIVQPSAKVQVDPDSMQRCNTTNMQPQMAGKSAMHQMSFGSPSRKRTISQNQSPSKPQYKQAQGPGTTSSVLGKRRHRSKSFAMQFSDQKQRGELEGATGQEESKERKGSDEQLYMRRIISAPQPHNESNSFDGSHQGSQPQKRARKSVLQTTPHFSQQANHNRVNVESKAVVQDPDAVNQKQQ